MDMTVNDFLSEINEIGAKKDTDKTQDAVWKECHDERTGFPYYWNTETDEVSWTKPKSFKPAKVLKRPKSPEKKGPERFLPPASAIHSTPSPKEVKIYSLQETKRQQQTVPTTPIYSLQQNLNETKGLNVSKPKQIKKAERQPFRRNSESDDEKIELITSYGGESDSDSETEETKPDKKEEDKPKLADQQEDSDEDEEDLLAKIQKRAKELKALGGDVPPEVKSIFEKPAAVVNNPRPAKTIAGFSLVGAYSDSEEEQDDEDNKTVLRPKISLPTIFNPTAAPPPSNSVLSEIGHSTLFPITKPVDVNDFIGPTFEEKEKPPIAEEAKPNEDVVDNKAFQRKRRIGVSLINSKKPKEDIGTGDSEHKGFGFKLESNNFKTTTETKANLYGGFQKGGVMFVKSDNILKPSIPETTNTNNNTQNEKKLDNNSKNDIEDDIEDVFRKAEAEDTYNIVKEKLAFLGEGRPAVLPVQVTFIQAETLFTAMKQNGLKVSYLLNWLEATGMELVSLEKQAAPEGWLLQWDRSHKRYYYQNQNTGETQWQYPEPDVDRYDEAMDICTTPPPPPCVEPPPPPPVPRLPSARSAPSPPPGPPLPVTIGPSLPPQMIFEPPPPPPPPSPPRIRHPSPPPPPLITSEERAASYNSIVTTVPVIDVPLPPLHPLEDTQPLPPGVDPVEPPTVSIQPMEPEPTIPATSDFNSVLDSFYSEIAETTTDSQSPGFPPTEEQQTEATMEFLNGGEEPLKKKKKKVKTAGLSLKKKGVSQLVEKWKNVQKDF